ncbi:MAG: nitroreductase family protein, partial [Pseudomonadota bacterium]|nr:nitroreductase family protein [Pseudomonadota bacterium]
MDVQQAVVSRRSVRDFLDTPVLEATLRTVIETATRSPSG